MVSLSQVHGGACLHPQYSLGRVRTEIVVWLDLSQEIKQNQDKQSISQSAMSKGITKPKSGAVVQWIALAEKAPSSDLSFHVKKSDML